MRQCAAAVTAGLRTAKGGPALLSPLRDCVAGLVVGEEQLAVLQLADEVGKLLDVKGAGAAAVEALQDGGGVLVTRVEAELLQRSTQLSIVKPVAPVAIEADEDVFDIGRARQPLVLAQLLDEP